MPWVGSAVVVVQHVLEVRRAGLGRADVEVDLLGHCPPRPARHAEATGAPIGGPSSTRIASASTPSSSGAVTPRPHGRLGEVAVDSVATGRQPPTEVCGALGQPRVMAARDEQRGPAYAARVGRKRCHISCERRSGVTRVPTTGAVRRASSTASADSSARSGRAGAGRRAARPGARRRRPRGPGRLPTRPAQVRATAARSSRGDSEVRRPSSQGS